MSTMSATQKQSNRTPSPQANRTSGGNGNGTVSPRPPMAPPSSTNGAPLSPRQQFQSSDVNITPGNRPSSASLANKAVVATVSSSTNETKPLQPTGSFRSTQQVEPKPLQSTGSFRNAQQATPSQQPQQGQGQRAPPPTATVAGGGTAAAKSAQKERDVGSQKESEGEDFYIRNVKIWIATARQHHETMVKTGGYLAEQQGRQ